MFFGFHVYQVIQVLQVIQLIQDNQDNEVRLAPNFQYQNEKSNKQQKHCNKTC